MVEALEFELEAFVVDPESVKNGGVEIADVDGILNDVVAEIVGLSIRLAR